MAIVAAAILTGITVVDAAIADHLLGIVAGRDFAYVELY